jgi:hypothetical protein
MESSTSQLARTPYEQFLRENLEAEKKKAEALALRYAEARGLRKIALKRDLDRLNQNIQILSSDLQKYVHGLEWLREPTKERDEKAEHLKPVPAEVLAGQGPSKAQPAQQRAAAPQPSGRPQIGTPVGGRPVIGQPRTAAATPAPKPATPQQPSAQTNGSAPSAPQTPATSNQAKPTTVGGRPRIGTPIGTPVSQGPTTQAATPQAGEQNQQSQAPTPAAPATTKRPIIGTPIGGRPRIGTPIGAPKPAPVEKKEGESESAQDSSQSESSSS